MNFWGTQLIYTLEEGLIFCFVTIGVFIALRLLKFPDLTAEGSFGFSAIISALVTIWTGSPYAGLLAGIVAGSLCGLVTAILANIIGLPTILASILTMTMCVSASLLIAKQPNLAMPDVWIFSIIPGSAQHTVYTGLFGVILVMVFSLVLFLIFNKSGAGILLRVRGDNPKLFSELGHSLFKWDVLGLCIANGFVGLAAVLFCQRAGYANINMGRGVAISAFAAIMLGESFAGLFKRRNLAITLFGCLVGVIAIRMVRLGALNIGLPDGSLDLFTSMIVIIIYYISRRRKPGNQGILESIRM